MVSKRTRHQKSTVTREKPNHFPPLSYSPVSVQPSWAQWRRDSNLVCMYMRYSLSEGHYRMRFTEAGKLTENFIFSVFQVMRHATPQPLAFITTTSYYNSAFQENIVEALKKKFCALKFAPPWLQMTINSTGVLFAFSTVPKLIRLPVTTTTAVRQLIQINHEGITS